MSTPPGAADMGPIDIPGRSRIDATSLVRDAVARLNLAIKETRAQGFKERLIHRPNATNDGGTPFVEIELTKTV
jgi:hypothetical protein